jgi:hypothetical protein
MEQYTCHKPVMKHTPLHKYKVICPAQNDEPREMDHIANDIKHFFTYKRKHCKINSNYSGLGVGQIVETRELGPVVVADFVVRNKVVSYDRWRPEDSTDVYRVKKKIRSVRNIIVYTSRNGEWYNRRGDLDLKKVKLSRKESKQLMIKHLVQRNKLDWLVRMYPEEIENLEALKARYGMPESALPRNYMERHEPFHQ